MAVSIAEIEMLIEDDTQKIFEYVLEHGCDPEKQVLSVHGHLSAFYERVNALPNFSSEWGCGIALSECQQLDLTEGKTAYGHLIFFKAGPTMYDVGECRKTYTDQMNLGVILLECDFDGSITDCRELTVNKKIFEV